jgi:nucleoside-diphosphate kinase
MKEKHPTVERTLTIIKPDGVQRSLIGEVIHRYERLGLKLVGIKMIVPTEKMVEEHYTLDPKWFRNLGEKTIDSYRKKGLTPPSEDPIEIANNILKQLKKYLTLGPVVAMVWQGANAVKVVKKITGGTEPLTSDVGTIRGDFMLDSYALSDLDGRAVRNVVHITGTPEEAEKEIKHWFKDEELIDYRLVQEQILYDVNVDGIFE